MGSPVSGQIAKLKKKSREQEIFNKYEKEIKH